jgi:hypothetical protein
MSCVRFGATNVHLQWHVSQSGYHRSSCVQSVLDARCCRCGCGTDSCNIANEGLANTVDIFAGLIKATVLRVKTHLAPSQPSNTNRPPS